MNKIYQFSINGQLTTLTLTPPNQWREGHCFKCQLEKEIWIISEKQSPTHAIYEEKKFCWSCSLANLYELEESNHKFENKKELIKEIRKEIRKRETKITSFEEKEELLECYG